MGTLNDIVLADGTNYPLAEYLNNLFAGLMLPEYANSETITGTKELTDADYWLQVITPSGADRTVELPPEATTNHVYFIKNPSGSTYDVVVKDDSGATTYCTLDAGQWVLCVAGGSTWHVVALASTATRLSALETYGSAVLGSSYSISAAAGTYADTGLSVTLPAAGTYLITADVRATMMPNTGTGWYIVAKLYNSTDAADVTESERMVARENAVVLLDVSSTINVIVTVAASKVIKLYAKRDGSGTPTFTTSDISSDGSGRTAMSYRRIS